MVKVDEGLEGNAIRLRLIEEKASIPTGCMYCMHMNTSVVGRSGIYIIQYSKGPRTYDFGFVNVMEC